MMRSDIPGSPKGERLTLPRIKRMVALRSDNKINEATEVQLFRSSTPKIPQGLSSFSFLNLANASSTPCDQLANSCSFTPSSRNSNRSCEIVMFNDFLLRFVTTIHYKELHKFLNKTQHNLCSAKKIFAGVLQNGKTQTISASSRTDTHGRDNDGHRDETGTRSIHHGVPSGWGALRSEEGSRSGLHQRIEYGDGEHRSRMEIPLKVMT